MHQCEKDVVSSSNTCRSTFWWNIIRQHLTRTRRLIYYPNSDRLKSVHVASVFYTKCLFTFRFIPSFLSISEYISSVDVSQICLDRHAEAGYPGGITLRNFGWFRNFTRLNGLVDLFGSPYRKFVEIPSNPIRFFRQICVRTVQISDITIIGSDFQRIQNIYSN